jgi:hypothetical protein
MKSKSPGSMRFRLTCFSTSLLLLTKKRVDKNVLINLKLPAYFACFYCRTPGLYGSLIAGSVQIYKFFPLYFLLDVLVTFYCLYALVTFSFFFFLFSFVLLENFTFAFLAVNALLLIIIILL